MAPGTRHLILVTFFQARLGDDICGVEDIGEEELRGRGVPQPLDMSSKCHHVRSRRIKTGFLIRTHKIDSENSSERSDITDTELALATDTVSRCPSELCIAIQVFRKSLRAPASFN